MDYQETSAKDDLNVTETFLSLARALMESGQAAKDADVIQIRSSVAKRRSTDNKGDKSCCSKS